MKPKQWLSGLHIWLLAVLFNTLLGTFSLAILNAGDLFDGDMIFYLLVYGAFFGAIVSLPAVLLLVLIVQRCLTMRLQGKQVFRIAMLSAFLLAAGAWLVFILWEPFNAWGRTENLLFLLLAVVSALLATATQRSVILRLAIYEEQFEII